MHGRRPEPAAILAQARFPTFFSFPTHLETRAAAESGRFYSSCLQPRRPLIAVSKRIKLQEEP